jgi:hypothetical protein
MKDLHRGDIENTVLPVVFQNYDKTHSAVNKHQICDTWL